MSGCTVCAGTGENLTGAICHGCHGTGRAPSTASVVVGPSRGLRPLTPEEFTTAMSPERSALWTIGDRANQRSSP